MNNWVIALGLVGAAVAYGIIVTAIRSRRPVAQNVVMDVTIEHDGRVLDYVSIEAPANNKAVLEKTSGLMDVAAFVNNLGSLPGSEDIIAREGNGWLITRMTLTATGDVGVMTAYVKPRA